VFVLLRRPEAGAWLTRRESLTLRGAPTPAVARPQKRERTPTPEAAPPPPEAVPPPPAVPSDADAPTREALKCPPVTPAAAAAAVAPAWHAACVPAPPVSAAPLWANPHSLAPCAFDLFRVDYAARAGGAVAVWADAHRAWLTLPPAAVLEYQRRAATAALTAAGFSAAACDSPLATPVLPSRVIATPMVLPGGVVGARTAMPAAG
jgi:hypothetical protein